MSLRLPEDGASFFVIEPEGGRFAPERGKVVTASGQVLTRRRHGTAARVEVHDRTGRLPQAALLRAAAAIGRALEGRQGTLGGVVRVVVHDGETRVAHDAKGVLEVGLAASEVAGAPVHHPLQARVAALLAGARVTPATAAEGALPGRPARRVLFFESLMNSDMPHNDCELSQGVLHMASTLTGTETAVAMANVKMSITGRERPVAGLDSLQQALATGDVDLVCITLLEGYFDGVESLIAEVRRLGCRAHIAVGGVMPTLTPEHVAAHLSDVSFVCRGAGEYFVPRLAAIVGSGDVDTPLSPAQRAALAELDGLLAIDRAGRRLISANVAHTVAVDSLDRTPLDLTLLQARHLQQGVELSTSRGCVHKCTFCSIIGRQSYQARSAENVFELLARYEERYRALFPEEVPRNAFRLHLSDDDFACDKARAIDFFRGLKNTPFRLASVQVSIADLCRKAGSRLLSEPDPELLDAITADCFADDGASIPERDFVLDHKSRRWSAYLQIGVETFSQREVTRLGKGYDIEHVRAMVGALARKRIHVDAYLILANADTSADDLVDSVAELCRLKLQHPTWFHVRFPIVPRLVSYFPSASHRRLVRRGQADAMRVRRRLQEPGYCELDYPLVQEDVPADAWVQHIDESVFTDEGLYTKTLSNLRERLLERYRKHESERTPERERLLRRLDDMPRRLVFDRLLAARQQAQRSPGHREEEERALASATELLGPAPQWLPAFRRASMQTSPRLVVIPTWQCELRCKYCYIPKQDGRVMSRSVLERSIELLLSSDRDGVTLQFFGGEALMEWELVRHGIEYARARADALGKRIDFILSSNGWTLDEEKLAWLKARPVKLELSLDGTPEVQNHARPARLKVLDSYDNGIAPRAPAIVASGLAHEVIMVVLPHNVARLAENFFHIAGLGFKRVQINFALGVMWTPHHKQAFADQLFQIGNELRRRWARGDSLTLINLEADPYPVRLNGEVTVDYDGTIYCGNGFLHETEHKQSLVVGHLDDLGSFDRYWMDSPDNGFFLDHGYPPEVTANNKKVGSIMASFVRYMQRDRDAETPRDVATA